MSFHHSLPYPVTPRQPTPSRRHTVTFRLPATAGKWYALPVFDSLTFLAPFAGVAFLVGFALYCLCQAVCEGSWRASLRRLGLTCMIVLSALAFRGARLAGEKVGGGTNETNRAGWRCALLRARLRQRRTMRPARIPCRSGMLLMEMLEWEFKQAK